MRILGGGMILGGCLGLGLWYRNRFIGRIKALRSLIQILELFQSEISYGKATLPECAFGLGRRLEEPYRGGMQEVYRIYQNSGGRSFGEAFCEGMRLALQELPLHEEDRESFLLPFRERGFQDSGMQLKCMGQGIGMLTDQLQACERELPGKCRVAVSLGGMGGLLVLVILL